MLKETKIRIIKQKILVQQAYMFYGLLFNGPMIVYIFWKSTEVKWIASLLILIGFAAIVFLTYVWFHYFYPVELEFSSNLNPEWRKLMENTEKEERQL
jgi:hypothetical protein